MPIDFKALLKSFRIRSGYGLRQFAEMIGDQPSNYSAIESGDRPPWRNKEKQRRVAEMLGLEQGSADWDAFFIGLRENGALPPDMTHLLERPMIPVLLRTVDELQLTEAQLRQLVTNLRKKHRKS